MNCLYCQKTTLEIDANFHRCLPCYTDFNPPYIRLSTRLKNKTWVVQLHYVQDEFRSAMIGNAWEPKTLLLWQDPKITPKNIKEKLKTYLLFS